MLDERTNRLCVGFVGAIGVIAFIAMVILSLRSGDAVAIGNMKDVTNACLMYLAATWQVKSGHVVNLPSAKAGTGDTQDADGA